MRCIAHRGFAGVNPENTLAGIEAAVAAGADAVEVDARRCGSGEVVVAHDETVDRVADAEGAVAEMDVADLRALDVLGTGAGVPTLGAVVEALPATVDLVVELKERGLAGDVARALADLDGETLVSSFDAGALRGMAAQPTGPALALLGGGGADQGADDGAGVALLETATDIGCAAVHPYHGLVDEDLVEDAHDRGLRVEPWTVRDGDTADRLAALGVDGIIADAPGFCRDG